jgi:hypothetical protein
MHDGREMMVSIQYYSAGIKEVMDCNFSLSFEGNSSILHFEAEKFCFEIHVKDHVELDDFHNFLAKKEDKIVLYCFLKQGKEYKGERKIVWKNNNLCVSLGGIRLEFEKSCQEIIIQAISSIKSKIG